MTAQSALIILFTILDLLCIFAVIFVERKNPASTIAWTLVLIFIPFLGFAAYLMFGSGFHVNKKKRFELKQVSDTLYKQVIGKHAEKTRLGASPEDIPFPRLLSYLQNDGGCFFTRDNDAHIFTGGLDMFTRMLDDIRKAEKHVHLLYYIFRNDALGRDIVRLLTEKARQGVQVRVMYDSLGSLLSGTRMFKPLIEAGGEVRAFSPLVFALSSHLRLNYRNHRKIAVIDGRTGYMGGMNVGVEYLGRHKKLHPWRDTQLRLTGGSVFFLQERFLMDWMYAQQDPSPPEDLLDFFSPVRGNDALGMQIASSGPDTENASIKNALLEMLYAARKNVFIQTPYFTPDDSFIDALRIAVKAGVDVRIMLPGLIDHLTVSCATYSYAWQLLRTGVRIYRYNGFLHAKTMVIDGSAATIGSANIGNRSFAVNFEINAFIHDKAFAGKCEEIFLNDQQHCEELHEFWFQQRSPVVRAAYGVCRLFSPLM